MKERGLKRLCVHHISKSNIVLLTNKAIDGLVNLANAKKQIFASIGD